MQNCGVQPNNNFICESFKQQLKFAVVPFFSKANSGSNPNKPLLSLMAHLAVAATMTRRQHAALWSALSSVAVAT
jgi:hypothetical protein